MTKPHRPNKGRSQEWFTPRWIVDRLAPFDMDPCLPEKRNGLNEDWKGRIFLNPPYDSNIAKWLEKLYYHGDGIALIFARTETNHFFEWVWSKADGILFLRKRLHFLDANGQEAKGNAGAPSCLVAYGQANAIKLVSSRIAGAFVNPQNSFLIW